MIARAIRVQATEHVSAVARRHHVELHWSRSNHQAHPRTRQAWVPPIYSILDYLVALHEVGHVVSQVSRRAYYRYVKAQRGQGVEHELVSESAAWGWAIDHAETELMKRMTKRDASSIGKLLLTYLISDEETERRLVPSDPDGYPVP